MGTDKCNNNQKEKRPPLPREPTTFKRKSQVIFLSGMELAKESTVVKLVKHRPDGPDHHL